MVVHLPVLAALSHSVQQGGWAAFPAPLSLYEIKGTACHRLSENKAVEYQGGSKMQGHKHWR